MKISSLSSFPWSPIRIRVLCLVPVANTPTLSSFYKVAFLQIDVTNSFLKMKNANNACYFSTQH